MNKYLEILLEKIRIANHITNEKMKCEYLYQLSSYASFIYYSGYIDEKDFNMAMQKITVDPSLELYLKERNRSIYDLVSNNKQLNNFYANMLSLFHNYQVKKQKLLKTDKDIKNYFLDFLKYMNCYSLYEELERKQMISYTSPILDYSICISNRNDSYIVVKENDHLYRYLTLSHEIAHAMENRLLQKEKKYFDASYNTEIMSITFTRIFMDYLLENNALSLDELRLLKNNFEVNYFNFLEWSFLITEAIKYDAFDIDDYSINLYIKNHDVKRSLTDHNYSLGSISSISLYNEWKKNDCDFIKDIPNIIHEIDKMNLRDLLNYCNNMELVQKELNKTLKIRNN